MRSLYRLLTVCAIFWCTLISYNTYASHAMGADLSYTCLGNNQYRITLNFYRDCSGITPSNHTVTIKSAACNVSTTLTLTLQSTTEVSQLCSSQIGNSTCNGGTLPGVQQYTYTGTYTFPSQCTDWVIGYAENARNSAVTNLQNPGSVDLYVEAHLNNANGLCDNSPVFTSLPTPFECNGNLFFYNHGGVDVDGDSLAYTLINPLSGANSPITYVNGYSVSNPMATTAGFSFDPLTGQMSATPSQLQNAVVTVLVTEYRNGVAIGSTMRDIQIVVITCPNNNAPTASGFNGGTSYTTTISAGQTSCFNINTNDLDAGQIVTMTYNNGIPGATFTSTTTSLPVGTFCWTPTLADVGVHHFVITVRDNACPNVGSANYSYTVNVVGFGVNLGNDTALCASTYTIVPHITNADTTATYTYLWNNGATTPTLTVTASGTYAVVVTDNNGFQATDTVNVTLYSSGSQNLISLADTIVCPGQPVTLTANQGYASYHWSNGDSTLSTTVTVPGVYIVTATNAAGCNFYDTVTVRNANNLSVNLGPDTSFCAGAGASYTFNAGAGFASYLWSDGSTNPTLTVTNSGVYSVTVTSALGCVAVDTASVNFRTPPFVTLGNPVSVCHGPVTLSIRRPPGFTYQWNTGNTSASQVVDSTGNYGVTVTDQYGCSASASVHVTISVVGSLNLFPDTAIGICQGAFTVLEPVTGNANITHYHWSTGDSSRTITVTSSGYYSLTVSDSAGCTKADTIHVNQSSALVATVQSNSGCLPHSGTIDLTVTGGAAPYTYNWSGPNGYTATTEDLQGVYIGTYHVIVSDALGCSVDATTTIGLPSINVDAGPDSVFICQGSSTQLNATGGVFYHWSPADGLSDTSIANPVASPTATTTYIVTGSQPSGELVTNGDFSQGNTGFTTDYGYTTTNLVPEGLYAVVPNPNPLHPAFHGLDHTTGTGNFMAINGAVTPGKKIWCQNVLVNPGVDYSFSTWITTLVTNSPAVLDFTINGQSLGTPIVAPSSDSTWIQFFHVWNSGNDTSALICIVNTNTAAGGNDFGLDDISFTSLCSGTDSITVVVNTPPTVHLSQNDTTCMNTPFTYDAGAGFASYHWSDGSTGQTLTTSVAGTYSVTVTDANGCSGTDSTTLTVVNCCFPSGFGNLFTTIDNTNNIISADQVWSGKYYVTADVHVTGNATLDLTNVDVVFLHGKGMYFEDNSRIKANNSVFRPCDLSQSWTGFSFLDNSSGEFNQNLVRNPEVGMNLRTTKSVTITNSQFLDFAIGLMFDHAGGNAYDGGVTGNTFTNDDSRPLYYDSTGLLTDFFAIKSYSTLFSGIISQNDFVNAIQQSPNTTVAPNRYYGVYLNASGVSATSNTFTNMYRAFDITGNGQAVTMENNTIEYTFKSYSNIYPIRITDVTTSPSMIQGNKLTYSAVANNNTNQVGVYVDNVRNLIVANNSIKGFNTLLRIGGGSQFINVLNNTFTDAHQFGVYINGGSNYLVSSNTVDRIGEAGIYLQNVLENAEVSGNQMTIDNYNNSYGVRYVVDSGTVSATTVKVADNCIKNTSNALQFTSAVPNTIPVISNNYLYNYQSNGLWNIGFTGQVGSCNNYPAEVGRNSFVSNYLAPFGTALDVRSDSTVLTMAGNSANLVINFPNVLVNPSCNTNANAACGEGDGGGRLAGPLTQLLLFQDMIESHYPLNLNGDDYMLNTNYLTVLGNMPAADRMKTVMTMMDILNQNTTSSQLDRFFSGVANASLVSNNDLNWMSYIYSSYKKDFNAAASYLAAYVPADANATDLVTIEGIRNNLALNNRSVRALTQGELSTLSSIDDRDVHFSAIARDMVQSNQGEHDYKFQTVEAAASVEPGAIDATATGNDFLTIFPNPATDNVVIRFYTQTENLDKVSIRITDVLGQQLYNQPVTFNNGQVTVDISMYASGPYIVSLMNGKEVIKYTKLVKF